jgi:NAD(P)-dependent dehydrogenase (short-subunit alcohol dehydrogenase family)
MGQLEGKVAIITGGGTGIGKGTARAFATEGVKLVLASRNQANLEAAAAELQPTGATVVVAPTDVTREGQVIDLFERTVDTFGRLDILVNNSAAFDGGPLDEVSLEAWRKVIDVNLTGPFLCVREALKIMKRQKGGRIINIGSISAMTPRENFGPYTSSKHGLIGLTKTAALEGRPYGISVSCVHPGNVLVERRMGTGIPKDQDVMLAVEEVVMVVMTMAQMPDYANMLEAVVLPIEQAFLGRG